MRTSVSVIAFAMLLAFCAAPTFAQTKYDFVVKFDSYKLPKRDGSWNTPVKKPSTISFSKNGQACLEFGDKKYEFEFHSIRSLTLKWETSPDGFELVIDDDNSIYVQKTPNFALVNIEKVCPYMNLLGWSNPEILSSILKFISER